MKQIYHLMMICAVLICGIMTVNAQKSLDDLNSWDKYYFTENQSFDFIVTEGVSSVKVNDKSVNLSSGQFTTTLSEGENTIKTYKEKTIFLQGFPRTTYELLATYTLNAVAIDYNINNGEVINAGDDVTIIFNELDVPIAYDGEKNPAHVQLKYTTDISGSENIESASSTQGGSALNTLTFSIPVDAKNGDIFNLTNGHVYEDWWGNALYEGQDPYKGSGGWMDPNYSYNFYTLPNITITVGESNNQGEADVITVENPLADIEVEENANSNLIPLTNVFTSAQGRDIAYSILSNSNEDLVTATIENNQLKLSYTEELFGNATVTIQAETWRATASNEISITVTEGVIEDPILTIDYNFGFDSNEVPDDWQNDLWITSNFQIMSPGEKYNINARRVPEIIDNPINNNVELPTFTYTVVSGNSVRVNDNGVISAKHAGPSIVEVSYLAKEAFGKSYAPCSPINKSYIAIEVVDNKTSDIDITTNIDVFNNTYHTYYYTGESYDYSFTASATNSDELIVKCNGIEATKNDGSYTVQLKNRTNIIEVKAQKGEVFKREFFVVDARKIEIEKTNLTDPDQEFEEGDNVRISFKGISIPVYKLATIYNPSYPDKMFGGPGDFTRVAYSNSLLGKVTTKNPSQYNLGTNNSIEVTLDKPGKYQFTNGHIDMNWWGDPLGTEKGMTEPGAPNLNADFHQDELSFLPDFTINVKGYISATFEDIELEAESEQYADATKVKDYESVEETITSGSYEFKNTATNWGYGTTSWNGIAVSNRTDYTSEGNVGNQFNSAAGGDIEGTGNYAIVYDGASGGMGGMTHTFFANTNDPEGRVISGMYVTNTTYSTSCIVDGNFASRPFGYSSIDDKEADADGTNGILKDWFKLIAEGIDKDGESTGTVEFYLADYRFENNTKDYMLTDWEWMDLSSLGKVTKISVKIESSDSGQYGMNTPAYFAMDNIDQPRLILKNQIENITVGANAADQVIDLSNVFEDAENTDITKEIIWNTNSDLITASINGNELKLEVTEGMSGTAEIMLKGKSQKMAARTSFVITVGTPTSLDNKEIRTVKFYPVPFDNQLTIEGADNYSAYKIFSLTGRMVLQGQLNSSSQSINTSKLNAGTYIISVVSNNQVITRKIIKR